MISSNYLISKVCAHGPGFKTSVKWGDFVPAERDGVEAAGKRRTRWALSDVGILKGEIATRGQTIQYKSDTGCSSGAPGQDHYSFPLGRKVVDTEFPLGKSNLGKN